MVCQVGLGYYIDVKLTWKLGIFEQESNIFEMENGLFWKNSGHNLGSFNLGGGFVGLGLGLAPLLKNPWWALVRSSTLHTLGR